MNVFEFTDYKLFLKANIEENRLIKAYQSKLADAIGCQKSFFSQVLNSTAQLSIDHAANLCEYWQFDDSEANYFVDLVLLARSGSGRLNSLLKARLKGVKTKRGDPSEKFRWPQIADDGASEIYYSSWSWAAVHIIVSIEKFDSASSIAQHLAIPTSTVEAALAWLLRNNLIEAKETKGWSVTSRSVYLPNTSPMIEAHHLSWRQKAAANIQKQDRSALHYTSLFSLSERDFFDLKESILSHIETMNKKIGPSSSEELVCFSCDLFKL